MKLFSGVNFKRASTLIAAVLVIVTAMSLSGCSWEDEADVASYNYF